MFIFCDYRAPDDSIPSRQMNVLRQFAKGLLMPYLSSAEAA